MKARRHAGGGYKNVFYFTRDECAEMSSGKGKEIDFPDSDKYEPDHGCFVIRRKDWVEKGGRGSGNRGHAGRPGQIGGSSSPGGMVKGDYTSYPNWYSKPFRHKSK